MQIFLSNNNIIELHDLRSLVTGLKDNAATVTVTIKDMMTNEPVIGQAWPTSMAFVQDGLYRATLSPLLELSPNRLYLAVVDAVGTGSEYGHWETEVASKVRR